MCIFFFFILFYFIFKIICALRLDHVSERGPTCRASYCPHTVHCFFIVFFFLFFFILIILLLRVVFIYVFFYFILFYFILFYFIFKIIRALRLDHVSERLGSTCCGSWGVHTVHCFFIVFFFLFF